MTRSARRQLDPQHLCTGVVAVALLVHWWKPVRVLPIWPSRIAGGVLVAMGAGLGLAAAVRLARAHTTLDPEGQPIALIAEGPYRWSRNPIYIGYALFYSGIALVVDSLWPLPPLAGVMLYLDRVVIPGEEARLESAFGDAYRRYRARVRRWLGVRSR